MKKLLFLLIVLFIPTIVNAENNIIIKGDLYDQRADFSIFHGRLYGDSFNNTIVSSSLNSKMNPTFLAYNYYSSYNTDLLYTDRWFNDYGYNPLQRIYKLSDSLISNTNYSSSLRQWTYKAMYLSLEAASEVVIETRDSIAGDYSKLAHNAEYIYSLTRVESLLEKVCNDLKTDSHAYDNTDYINSALTSIFSSYIYPEDNSSYKANGIVFPNITLPSDYQEINELYKSLVDNEINKQMINDNTTKFYLNIKKDYSIELIKKENGMYEYNSNSFFIADNFGIGEDLDPNNGTNYFWGSSSTGHNYLFTYTFKLQIKPEIGDEFTFTGDDDVWVYLSEDDNPSNNFLVINLGGIHASESSSFKFTEGENGMLNCSVLPKNSSIYNTVPLRTNIDPNKKYNLHLFFSERRPEGSNFRIVTNVLFTQSPKPILESDKIVFNNPTKAVIKLVNEYSDDTVFRLYDSLGNEKSEVLDTINNNQIVLTFNEPLLEKSTYYLTAQNSNETESDKVSFSLNLHLENNPKTNDNIMKYICLLLISSLILFGLLNKQSKKNYYKCK